MSSDKEGSFFTKLFRERAKSANAEAQEKRI